MKNIEKYEKEIKNKIKENGTFDCAIKGVRGHVCDEDFRCTNCGLKSLDWLLEEYEEPTILTNKEKIIIKNILKAFEPFGKELSYITKECWDYGENCCFLNFKYGDDNFGTLTFNQNKLFKGMEINKCYTLGGLGL